MLFELVISFLERGHTKGEFKYKTHQYKEASSPGHSHRITGYGEQQAENYNKIAG
jgi:hypothetical protein